MTKEILTIKSGHPLYGDVGKKLSERKYSRFKVKLQKRAVGKFIDFVKKLSERDLPHGALLMMGYVHGFEENRWYFSYGINPDMAVKTHSILSDFDDTLDTVVQRAQTKNKHDGAFLLCPNGLLYRSGAGLKPPVPVVLDAYGYRDYYQIKRELGLKEGGGFRLEGAITQSMVFLDALFASISAEKDSSRKFFVHNRKLSPIAQYTIDQYYNNPPAQSYRPLPHP